MTPWRIRSLLSLSIVLSTAVARWRAPACRYPSSTSFVMTAKDATRRSKRITTPPMRHPPTSPEGYFSRLCRKSLSRSGPFGTGLTRTRSRLAQEEVFHDELPFAGDERTTANRASYFESDGLRPRFGFDDLVKRVAAWAELSRRHLLECLRHRHPPQISRSLSTPIRDMAMANPEVCVVPIVEVRPRFSMTSSVVMLRVQTRLVSASDFRERPPREKSPGVVACAGFCLSVSMVASKAETWILPWRRPPTLLFVR